MDTIRAATARLPDALPELCLVRLGIQTRGLGGLIQAARFGRAIDRAAAEAIATDAGLLRSERFSFSRNHFGVLQYWRSFDELEAWSHRPPHSDWWREAADRIRTKGDVGVYHETFLVPRDRIETIALNCQPTGLTAFGTLGTPVGSETTSRGRLGRSHPFNLNP